MADKICRTMADKGRAMKLSLRLREEVAEERAVIRWLEAQGNQSDAVRAVLVAHVAGPGGASLLALNDKVDRVLRMLAAGVSLAEGAPSGAVEAGRRAGGDGLGYLDELGI